VTLTAYESLPGLPGFASVRFFVKASFILARFCWGTEAPDVTRVWRLSVSREEILEGEEWSRRRKKKKKKEEGVQHRRRRVLEERRSRGRKEVQNKQTNRSVTVSVPPNSNQPSP